MKFIWVGTPTD